MSPAKARRPASTTRKRGGGSGASRKVERERARANTPAPTTTAGGLGDYCFGCVGGGGGAK
jgi:hypothetical protein